MGARTATTAVAARFFAIVSAVPPVTQPPQLNPTIARIIAPAAAPHSAGFTAAFVSLGIFITFTFALEVERVSSTHNARRGSPTLRPFLRSRFFGHSSESFFDAIEWNADKVGVPSLPRRGRPGARKVS